MANLSTFEELTRSQRKEVEKQVDDWEKQIRILEEKVQKECVKLTEFRSTRDQAFLSYMQTRMPDGYRVLKGRCRSELENSVHEFSLTLLHATHVMLVEAEIDIWAKQEFRGYNVGFRIIPLEGIEMKEENHDTVMNELKAFVEEDMGSLPSYRLLAITSDWLNVRVYKDDTSQPFSEKEKDMYEWLLQGKTIDEVRELAQATDDEHYDFKRKLRY